MKGGKRLYGKETEGHGHQQPIGYILNVRTHQATNGKVYVVVCILATVSAFIIIISVSELQKFSSASSIEGRKF